MKLKLFISVVENPFENKAYILENASPLLFTYHLKDYVVIKKVKSREEVVALILPPE